MESVALGAVGAILAALVAALAECNGGKVYVLRLLALLDPGMASGAGDLLNVGKVAEAGAGKLVGGDTHRLHPPGVIDVTQSARRRNRRDR